MRTIPPIARLGLTSLSLSLALWACGGAYAQKGRYAGESQDRRTLTDEAYQDLAEIRGASDYDAITDFAVECVSQTVQGEQLVVELDGLAGDAYGARETLRTRAQQAATRCLIACPRVQAAENADVRDVKLGQKYGPRCERSFGHGALQLREGERLLAHGREAASRAQWLDVREALINVRGVLSGLSGESSTRQSALAKGAAALRDQYAEPLARADIFAADPWVVATRGRLHAIGLQLGKIEGDPRQDATRKNLQSEQQDLSQQLYERRQQDGI